MKLDNSKLTLTAQETEVETKGRTVQSLLDYSNAVQNAMFAATNQLAFIVNDLEIPDDKKIIPRPAVPKPNTYLFTQNTSLIDKVGEFDVSIGALQTKLASNKQGSMQLNSEIARQKGAIDALNAEMLRIKTEIDKLSKPTSTSLSLGPAPMPPVIVIPNAEVKTLRDRIQDLEDIIVDKNNDLYALET